VVLGKTFQVGEHFESGGGSGVTLENLDLISRPDASCMPADLWIVGDVG
jgi:hypothetical protein